MIDKEAIPRAFITMHMCMAAANAPITSEPVFAEFPVAVGEDVIPVDPDCPMKVM